MKLSFGNRKEKRGRRAVTLEEKRMKRCGGGRDGEKFEDKSTSSHADFKKHCIHMVEIIIKK